MDLWVARRYRIALPPSELFKRIQKRLCRPRIDDITETEDWVVFEEPDEGYREFQFQRSLPSIYIRGRTKSYDLKKPLRQSIKTEKLLEEFSRNLFERSRAALKALHSYEPFHLSVLISEVDKLGCVCIANCRPALEEQLRNNLRSIGDVPEHEINRSIHDSEEFLDKLFIGRLHGQRIPKAPVEGPQSALLVNDINLREITKMIDSLLGKAKDSVLMCGWIGGRYLPKLTELASEGVEIRIITHRSDAAKGQPWRKEIDQATKGIRNQIGEDAIRYDYTMHGRMVIVDNKALIGSMDLNSYSLDGTHTEFAVYTEQPEIVRRLKTLFDSRFKLLGKS